ncbi:MAG: DUF2157 domain-containing protein [Actinomycetota bacterium]
MTDLERAIDRWVAAGLITDEQAARIRDAERIATDARPPRRLPLLSEALGYLGGALATVAIGLLVGQLWDDLEDWARIALPAFGALVLWAGGLAAGSSDEPALRRLRSFVWFLSPVALVFSAGIYGDDIAHLNIADTALLCSIVALAYAIPLWIASRSALQHLVTFGAVMATAVTLLVQLEDVDVQYFGLLVWSVGLAWSALAWGQVVQPGWTGYALGSLALLGGPNIFAIDELRFVGLSFGLVTAAALIGASVFLRAQLLLWFGAAGVFVFVPQATFEFFGDALGAPVALLVAGIIVLAMGLIVPRLRGLTKAVPDAR